MSFIDLPRGAVIPEHNRLRGLDHGNPHPQYAEAAHSHDQGGPLGVLARSVVTADVPLANGSNDLTDLSVTVTVGAGRLLRVTGHGLFLKTTSAGFIIGYVVKNGAAIDRFDQAYIASGASEIFDGGVLDEPAAGTHTYMLNASVVTGDGVLQAGAAYRAHILVEDIGAA